MPFSRSIVADALDDLLRHCSSPTARQTRLPRTIASYGISTVSSPERTTTALLAGARRPRREAACARRVRSVDLAADRVAEVLGRAERALDARRGDVDRVLAQVLAQHVGDARAERVVDALGVVDEDGEPLGADELDGEHLDARQGRLDLPSDLLRQCPLLLVCCAQPRVSSHRRLARRCRSRRSSAISTTSSRSTTSTATTRATRRSRRRVRRCENRCARATSPALRRRGVPDPLPDTPLDGAIVWWRSSVRSLMLVDGRPASTALSPRASASHVSRPKPPTARCSCAWPTGRSTPPRRAGELRRHLGRAARPDTPARRREPAGAPAGSSRDVRSTWRVS